GGSALDILYGVRDGGDWRGLASRAFEGAGSHGNGAAMRIAPLGAWFADSIPVTIEQARLASEVTHTHVDGIAGGIAVAVAAALAAGHRPPDPEEFIATVADLTPDSAVRAGLRVARAMGGAVPATHVAEAVGNGSRISAADTVPVAIWTAAWHLDDFPRAVRTVVSVGGDMDTTAAIVGGIVAAGSPRIDVPPSWAAAREPLPDWLR
ncbi:MAG: ADP-ribosylglycohydrolase family protein, partial [Stackebrandtia sp.]